ncbi:glycoside hydrolase family 5 protein [Cucurbitaria berberidis CBS 394.84]|uniref:glucan 1,3-beta-glucosidase n=1 Tax=Cucurbitaria berberidis CBS 394.84 TaxID=1168544 RepID=A0A9P4GRA4_9PLEO|nr:glycoside hydrolase family 5 protein [Cucurbitaria berberidis CBS 394.84]KAF1850079.1 glycoside hydrolase family 5 protein [Cucurbitaria berberidis CBS 394.84]
MPDDSDRDRDPARRRPHGEERRRRRESHGEHDKPERRRRRDESRGENTVYDHGDLLPQPPRRPRHQSDTEQESPSPRKARQSRRNSTSGGGSGSRSRGSGAPLSLDALAKLDKTNAKKAGGWGSYDYDDDYLREVRKKEKNLEKERVKEERAEKKKEKREEENHRRAGESDAAIQDEKARRRREEKRRAAESKRAHTEDEREGKLKAAKAKKNHTEDEREEKRKTAAIKRAHAEDEREVKRKVAEIKKTHTEDEREKRRSAHTDDEREERRRRHEAKYTPSEADERRERKREEKQRRMEQKKRRVISGPLAEEGGIDDEEYQYMMEKRGGGGRPPKVYTQEEMARKKKRKRFVIGIVSALIILVIIIAVAVIVSKKSKDSKPETTAAASASEPKNNNLDGKDRSSVPKEDQGGILDPWVWFDTQDFNVTYTKETVGGLPIIGLNSTWDDDVQANPSVPKLSDTFDYGKMPIRGVNVGGWLNLEPFITPSYFEKWGSKDGVVDEWTLLSKLGPTKAKDTMERHYSAFVNRQTFVAIRAAGLDHVRFPFGYWIVQTYDGDPYIPQIAWRYLLRGIEYCRQNGLRVNLDLHGAPGSQNGWNHSGRQGVIGWLNGTDGDLNAQRTLDIHHKLSVFFAQDRYQNLVTMYGLVNEPRNVELDTHKVVAWSQKAITQIRADGIKGIIVFGDGFMGLDNWQGKLQGNDKLLLDVHQYVIFNVDQLSLKHRDKLNFACEAWTQQSRRSMDKKTGFGPTMCGEWSQADTDCAQYINNVARGTRWEGTFDTGNPSSSVLKPQCPVQGKCSCDPANADPSSYSTEYKKWLYQFAIAQMDSFEAGWGWFYWTWETEKATQWSYRRGLAAGILPKKAYDRDWKCPGKPDALDDFGALPEFYRM